MNRYHFPFIRSLTIVFHVRYPYFSTAVILERVTVAVMSGWDERREERPRPTHVKRSVWDGVSRTGGVEACKVWEGGETASEEGK